MRQTKENIKEEILRLREFIDKEFDTTATRIAYEVEQALRWAIEDTEDWQKPLESVLETVRLLKEGK